MAPLLRRADWLVCSLATTGLVLLGVQFGRCFLAPPPGETPPLGSFADSLVNWDGTYYRDIAVSGYSYDPGRQSTVHFFPLYPLVCRSVMRVTGLPPALALFLTSNVCFAAALLLLGKYTDLRGGPSRARTRLFTLASASLLPAGVFFRVGYSEALFFLLCITALYLMERGRSPLLVAVAIGLATAARPVGVALLPALALYLWRWADRPVTFAALGLLSVPVAVSGVALFSWFCHAEFGDPFAFAHNTAHWFMRTPLPLSEKVLYLLALGPVWDIFRPSSPASFTHYTSLAQAPFSLYAANPIYFLVALILIGAGTWKRWLNRYEIVTALGLLLIPYWTTAYEVQMMGMARYVSVIFPLYLVLGRLLTKLPPSLAVALLALQGFFLGVYAALFARWYCFV